MGWVNIIRHIGGEPERVAFSGRLIDFLERDFPRGFEGQAACICGPEGVIALDDYARYEVDDCELWLGLGPAGGETVLFLAAIAAAITVSVAVTLLMQPKTPGLSGGETAASVYAVGAKANAAKIGAHIPVPFGRFTWTPDYAAQPYREYDQNRERRKFLLVAGQGDVDVTAVKIGATDAADLPPGVVRWQVFKPADHRLEMGVIGEAFGMHENVWTSGDVADQDLEARMRFQGRAKASWSGDVIRFDDVSTGDLAAPDDEIILSASRANGTYRVAENLGDGRVRVNRQVGFSSLVEIDVAIKATESVAVGPFLSCPLDRPGEDVQIDLEFAGGLHDRDDENALTDHSVTFEARLQPVDAGGENAGDVIVRSLTVTAATVDAIFRTWVIDDVPAVPYLVSVRRSDLQNRKNQVDRVKWTALRARLALVDGPVYGNNTLIALEVVGARELSSRSQSEIKITTERAIAPWDGGAPRVSANVADVIAEIVTNPAFGAGQPRALLSADGFAEIAGGSTKSGFNGVFDARTTVADAMRSVAQLEYATPVPTGAKLMLARDIPKSDKRAAIVTPDVILKDSVKITPRWYGPGEADGVRIIYYDAETGAERTATYPKLAARPETQKMIGMTNEAEAEAMAEYLWLQKTLRIGDVEFATEWDARGWRKFDRVGVCFPLFNWGDGGQVEALIEGGVRVDERRAVPLGACYVCLRDPMGGASDVLPAIGNGAHDLLFDAPDGFEFILQGQGVATLIAWGTKAEFLQDVSIDRVSQGKAASRVMAKRYIPEVYRSQL